MTKRFKRHIFNQVIYQKILPFLLLLLLCQCFCQNSIRYGIPNGYSTRTVNGLEVFIKKKAYRYKGQKTALITNHSGIDYDLNYNILLLRKEGIKISHVFAPEHGIYGTQEEYSKKTSHFDETLQVTIYNMHKLAPHRFKQLLLAHDIVIFDIQDMGMRCYTYISNLKRVIDLLQGSDKELIVLDRPNPIAPLEVDGFNLDNHFSSKYISAFPAPLIYGFTIGEAALYYHAEYAPKLRVTIVKMEHYNNDKFFPSTGQPWVPPSPNLPSFHSAIIYSSVVLMEGINLSLGRGTANPFEYIGAPWIEPVSFSRALNKLDIKHFSFRPVYFTPKYSKYTNQQCGGVQIFYRGGTFSPTEIAYKIIRYLKHTYPECTWETYGKQAHIDFLAGTNIFRTYIEKNKPYSALKRSMQQSCKIYMHKMRKYQLYEKSRI